MTTERAGAPTRRDLEMYGLLIFERGAHLTGAALVARCGYDNTRRLREAVARLRSDGRLVCSDHSGYWYPKDAQDAQTNLTHNYELIRSAADALKGMKRGIEERFGASVQLEMEF